MIERPVASTRTKSLEFSRFVPYGLSSPDITTVKDPLFYGNNSRNKLAVSSKKMIRIYRATEVSQHNSALEREKQIRESLTTREKELSFTVINLRKMQDQHLQVKLAKRRTDLQVNSGQKIFDQNHQRNVNRLEKQRKMTQYTGKLPIIANRAALRDVSCPQPEISSSNALPESDLSKPANYKFRLLDRQPDNLWNKYSVISMKNLKNCVNEKIVKMDEQGYRNIEAKENQAKANQRKLQASRRYIYCKIRGLQNKALPSQSEIKVETFGVESKGQSMRLKFDDSKFAGLLVNDVNRVPERSGNPLVEYIVQRSHLANSLGFASLQSSTRFPQKPIEEHDSNDDINISKECISKMYTLENPKSSRASVMKMTSRKVCSLKRKVDSIQDFEQRKRMRRSIVRDVNYPRIYLDQIKYFIF